MKQKEPEKHCNEVFSVAPAPQIDQPAALPLVLNAALPKDQDIVMVSMFDPRSAAAAEKRIGKSRKVTLGKNKA